MLDLNELVVEMLLSKRKYLITGLNEGVEIKPYVIHATIDELDKHLNVGVDSVRYYEEIK